MRENKIEIILSEELECFFRSFMWSCLFYKKLKKYLAKRLQLKEPGL